MILILLILAFSVVSVNAEVIDLTYNSYSSFSYDCAGQSSGSGSIATPSWALEDAGAWQGLTHIVQSTTAQPIGATARATWTTASKSTDVDLLVGTDIVGSGEWTTTLVYNEAGNFVSTIGVLVVDSLDISQYDHGCILHIYSENSEVYFDNPNANTGWAQHSYYYDETYETPAYILGNYAFIDHPGIIPAYQAGAYSDRYWWGYLYGYKLSAYCAVDFDQRISYATSDDGMSVELSLDRNDVSSYVTITGNSDLLFYSHAEPANIPLTTYYDIPLEVNVTNPYTGSIWSNLIPETTGPATGDPAEFTSYIYDAQTGHLISGASTTKTYDDLSSSSTSDPSGVVQDVVYWEDTAWASFTAYATGYYNSTVVFNYTSTPLTLPDLMYAAPGSSNIQSFHLIQTTAPSNSTYALTFQIQQEISPNSGIFSRSVDATVNCDGIQHLTGPSGTTWYNVTAGSHAYTVSKNGFETVQGSVTVSTENMMETAYLHLSQSEPTPIGNETSGEVGDEDMHEAVAEAYAEFAAFIPEAVMIGCVLFLLAMFKKF